MSTLFARKWEKVCKDPGAHSLTDLDDLLGDATAEQAVDVIARALTWIAPIATIPGGAMLRDGYRQLLMRAFARLHEDRGGMDHRAYRALLKRSLPLAERVQALLWPGTPALVVWRIKDALAELRS